MKKNSTAIALIACLSIGIVGFMYFDRINILAQIRNTLKNKMLQDFTNTLTNTTDITKDTNDNKQIKYSFAVISDIHNNTEELKQAIEIINKQNEEFVVGLGDYTDVGTTEELTKVSNELKNLNKKFYSVPGDHDLWNGRDKGTEPITYYQNIFGKTPEAFISKDIQFIFLNNADLYTGINQEELNNFYTTLENTPSETIIIFSHKAIYHPLTIHKMGYVGDEKNDVVLTQADEISSKLTATRDKKIYLMHGDLHSSSKFNGSSDNIKNFTIGALEKKKNFQTPRFSIANIYVDGTVDTQDVPVEEP